MSLLSYRDRTHSYSATFCKEIYVEFYENPLILQGHEKFCNW